MVNKPSDQIALHATEYYTSLYPTANRYASNLCSVSEDQIADLWRKSEGIPISGYCATKLRENKKPLLLSGLWASTIALNAFDPTGPASIIAGSVTAMTTRVAFKQSSLLDKFLLLGSSTIVSTVAHFALQNIPYLNNVPFASMNALLILNLSKGMFKEFVNPKKPKSPKIKPVDIENQLPKIKVKKDKTTTKHQQQNSQLSINTNVNSSSQNKSTTSIGQIIEDTSWFFCNEDQKPALWKRLSLLIAMNGLMVAATKYIPGGMLAYTVTQLATAPTVQFLRGHSTIIKYGAAGGIATGAYFLHEIHPKLWKNTLSNVVRLGKMDLKTWMDPKEGGDSDDESDNEEVIKKTNPIYEREPSTWYEWFKGKVKSTVETTQNCYSKVSSIVGNSLYTGAEKITSCVPRSIKNIFTKDEGDKPAIGKRVLATALVNGNAISTSALFPGETIEQISATFGSVSLSSFFKSTSPVPRYVVLTSLVAGGYLLQHYVLKDIPYIGHIQLGSLMATTLMSVSAKEIKKLVK